MCDSGTSVRGNGGGKWSTLRDAFLCAVAASKGEHATEAGGNGAGDSTNSSRFEGFVLFPRREIDPTSAVAAATQTATTAIQPGNVWATYHLPGGKK
ncbi:unnamed protein product, partial [Ectocarpus sp. 12 AP-2014]